MEDLIPTYLCLIVAFFLLGNTRFVRFFRQLITPAALCLIIYRVVIHFRAEYSASSVDTLSFYNILITGVDFALKKCSKPVKAIIGDVLGLLIIGSFLNIVQSIAFLKFSVVKKQFLDSAYGLSRHIPAVKALLVKEQKKIEESFEKDLKTKSRDIGTKYAMKADGPPNSYSTLPLQGVPADNILSLMGAVTKEEDVIWQTGKVSGAIYHGEKGHLDLLNKAFSLYSISNPLHPDIWPSGMKFESEIIAMTASLVGLDDEMTANVCGCTTSGGTESIILAIKAHRDYYRQKHGIENPELVCCVSAHAAVDKACDLMGIRLIKVPMDVDTCRIDLNAVKRAISSNTIMLYSSAPSFPQGVIDPIRAMGELAVNHGIGLHVDCCLGGFILPFAKKLGYSIPDFDFHVPGVSSMSLDTHKYGYALKGTSVLLYSNKELRQAQYFCYADWTGGLYTTPTLAGSRSGGLIAQTWASLVSVGEDGFMKNTKAIMDTTVMIKRGVQCIPGLKLVGSCEAMIVCFTGTVPPKAIGQKTESKKINVYTVADCMAKKGWSLNPLQNPACVHICCTLRHVGREQPFLDDLRASVEEIISSPNKAEGNAAIYGMTSSLPPGPVNDLLKIYNDVIFKL